MPSPTTTITCGTRVIHRGGRGKVVHLYAGGDQVAVLFDGAWKATRVAVRELVPLPANMLVANGAPLAQPGRA